MQESLFQRQDCHHGHRVLHEHEEMEGTRNAEGCCMDRNGDCLLYTSYVYYASGLIVGIVLYIGPAMLQHVLPQVPILENLFHALCISNIIELGVTVQSNGVSILSYLVTICLLYTSRN